MEKVLPSNCSLWITKTSPTVTRLVVLLGVYWVSFGLTGCSALFAPTGADYLAQGKQTIRLNERKAIVSFDHHLVSHSLSKTYLYHHAGKETLANGFTHFALVAKKPSANSRMIEVNGESVLLNPISDLFQADLIVQEDWDEYGSPIQLSADHTALIFMFKSPEVKDGLGDYIVNAKHVAQTKLIPSSFLYEEKRISRIAWSAAGVGFSLFLLMASAISSL